MRGSIIIKSVSAFVSTSIKEKTQKTLPVSTNKNGNQRKNALVSTFENTISQKTFFVSTKLDKYKLPTCKLKSIGLILKNLSG